jgi:hypothetical protein
MDAARFDRLTRVLAAPTRRGFLRTALAAAGLALTPAAAAAACETHAACAGCRRCSRRRGRCVAGCPGNTVCRREQCVRPCTTAAECGACEACVRGVCAPDPGQAGQPCGGCRVCGANGSCGVPANDRCPDGQICRPATGACGNRCVAETDRCHQGDCRHFCTLNPVLTVPCGGDTSATAFCCSPDAGGCCGDRCCPA